MNIRKRQQIHNVPADLIPEIKKVWSKIAADLSQEEGDHEATHLTNEQKIEMVLDGDRLERMSSRKDLADWVVGVWADGLYMDLVSQLCETVTL